VTLGQIRLNPFQAIASWRLKLAHSMGTAASPVGGMSAQRQNVALALHISTRKEAK